MVMGKVADTNGYKKIKSKSIKTKINVAWQKRW